MSIQWVAVGWGLCRIDECVRNPHSDCLAPQQPSIWDFTSLCSQALYPGLAWQLGRPYWVESHTYAHTHAHMRNTLCPRAQNALEFLNLFQIFIFPLSPLSLPHWKLGQCQFMSLASAPTVHVCGCNPTVHVCVCVHSNCACVDGLTRVCMIMFS